MGSLLGGVAGGSSILSSSASATAEGQQDLLLRDFHCVWLSGRVRRGTHFSCSPQALLPHLVIFPSSALLHVTAQRPPKILALLQTSVLQYFPVRLQHSTAWISLNFVCVPFKWLFILPIIISFYLAFIFVGFFPPLIITSVFQDFCTVLNLPTHSLFKQSVFKVLKSFEFIIRNVGENNQEKLTSCSYFWSFPNNF